MNRSEIRTYVDRFKGHSAEGLGIPDPRTTYGVTDADIHFFKYHDAELKAAIDKYTGMDFPVHTIDDFMIVELAGMLERLGAEAGIAEFKKLPRRVRALYRCVCRNHKAKMRGN